MSVLYLEIGVLFLAIVILLTDLVWGKTRSEPSETKGEQLSGWQAAAGLSVILIWSFVNPPYGNLFNGSIAGDGLALFLKRIFLFAGIIGCFGSFSYKTGGFERRAGEYYFLLLVALSGMMLLAAAREFIVLFVAFEIMSLPLYALAGFLKRDARSVEGALKFFLIGTVSSAIVLYGFSLVYGITRSTYLADIMRYFTDSSTGLPVRAEPLFLAGISFVLAGLGFKIAAVPFHMWVPDTYEGAPTPFVAFLSVAPKAAGFGALIRIFLEGFSPVISYWKPQAVLLAAISMMVGNLLALPQTNIKRLLGYSGIAHIGYALLGFAAATSYGLAMLLFYFVAYLFANMGAFLVVETTYRNEQSDHLDAYRGLAQRSPIVGLSMLLFLLSLGGIPFLAGFWAKLYIFLAAAQAGLLGLVLLGALLSVVALFYYLKIARALYIEAPIHSPRLATPRSLTWGLILTAVPVVLIGIYPTPFQEVAAQIASQFFGK